MNRSKVVSKSRNQKNSTKIKRRNIKETSIPLKSIYVDVSNSNISSFRFLSRLQKVLSVNATNTMISDFSGAPLCSTLRQIKIQGSPISKNPNYRLMILIMLCPDIEYIDNQKVTKSERDKSLSLQQIVQPNLYNGFIITSSDPVTLTRADETFVINPDDLKETKGKSHNEIKFDQTIEMMEKLSFEISNASDELGVAHIPKLPIRELLKQNNKINATDFLATNSKTALINTKKGKQSPFAKAFKEYTNTPEDLVESSILFDSPEKREERHSMIVQDSPSKYSEINNADQNQYNQALDQQVESDSQTGNRNYLNEDEENPDQVSIEQLYEDIVEPSIPNKDDITVEKIFGIASEIMASPEKPSRYFEENDSASSDLSTSLLQKTKQGNENSKIPIKLDSPSKKYGEGLAASRLTQTKFGGYRKISDTESISSEYDGALNEEEEEIQLTTTEDEAKIEFEEEEEDIQSNYFTSEKIENQEEEEDQAPPSKDMPDPDWVISEEAEKKSDAEQNPPGTNEATGNQIEIFQEEEEEQQPPSKDMPDPDWVIQEGVEKNEMNEQEQIQMPETTEQQQPEEEETNENQNQNQINQEEEEAAPPSKDMPDPDWVVSEETLTKSAEQQKPVVDEINDGQIEVPQEEKEEEEPVPPSKDMPDPDWVIQEGAENAESNEQEQVQTPETTEQQQPNAEDEIKDNQIEATQEEEEELAPPSKDMPDPDWVVSEETLTKSAEQIQAPETEQQQQPAVDDEINGNQEEIIQEEEEIKDNQFKAEQEEPAPPSKDMPDPDWVVSEETMNRSAEQEQIQAPEAEQRPTEEVNGNQFEVSQEEEEPAPPSKDMPDPDWVVSEETMNRSAEQEQIQAPEAEQQPVADEATEKQQQPTEEVNGNQFEVSQEEEEPAPPSKDMPDPDWVVQEGAENKETNEQEQVQTPEEEQQQQPPVEEINDNQAAEQDSFTAPNVENRSVENEEEPAPPSKDMPDPDWVVQEGAESKETVEQEQIQTPETTEQQQPAPEDEINGNQFEVSQEEEPAPPPSKDMPDPDWVVAEGAENKVTAEQEPIQSLETEQQQQPAPGEETNGNQFEINQEEEPAPPSKDMPDPDWVVSEETERKIAAEQELIQTPEAEQQQPATEDINAESKSVENEEEPAPPSKDMPDPDWVVQEGAENKETVEQEQIQTPEATDQQQPAANDNQIEAPKEEEEPAPPSKDMPDPDWVVREGAENAESNEQGQIQTPEATEQQQPAANDNQIEAPKEEEEPAPPSKDMPDPDWVVQEGAENKETVEQEQIQTPETTEQQQPAPEDEINGNQFEVSQEEEPAPPPSKDMPDPDWVVAEEDAANAQQVEASPQENPTTERSLEIENKDEDSSVTEGDNYDPEVIAQLDKQVQPRETVQIEGGQHQEENQQQEEPTFDPPWIIDENEISNQEQQQQQQSDEKNPFEVSQEGDQTEPKPENNEENQAESKPENEEAGQAEPKPENNEEGQAESKNEEEVSKVESENKEEAAEPPNEANQEGPSIDPEWIIDENEALNQQQNQVEEKNPFEASQEGVQSESAPKEEPIQEEPSLDPSWVIKSDEEQNEQPPWAT